MTMTTIKTITVEDLARTVNRLIAEQPTQINPVGDNSCLYHEEATDKRCIAGQALYELTEKNVPKSWEDNSIEALIESPSFCERFDLVTTGPYGADGALIRQLTRVQADADGFIPWGDISPIRI